MPGRVLNVKCYLEGIEVPFAGAQITVTTNQASSCTLSIPPTNLAFKIRPRTRVHLFWFDDVSGKWLLLWEGEVLSLGYTKRPGSRSLQLRCQDLSNYWDYTLKMLFNLRDGAQVSGTKTFFFGNTSCMVHITPTAAQDKIWTKLTNGDDLPRAVSDFLKQLTDQMPYYQSVNARMKLNRQLQLVDDDRAKNLLKVSTMVALTSNLVGRQGDTTSIRDIINSFCSLINYTHGSLGAPAYLKHQLTSFLLKPNTYGCLPPRCNVLFPDTCGGIEYSRDFMQEPTRAMCRAQMVPGQTPNDLTSPVITAPTYLFDSLKSLSQPNSEDIFKIFTDEELEKGVVPQVINLPCPELLSIDPNGGSGEEYSRQYVDYMFQMARYAGRGLGLNCELNPWLVCNFPLVVFDATRSYFAQVDTISHTIDASGGGYTNVSCSLAREVDVAKDDSPFISNAWFSEKYQPTNIHSTYQDLLGCAALGDRLAAATFESPGTAAMVGSGAAYQLQNSSRVNTSRVAATVYDPANPQSSAYHHAAASGNAYAFADAYRRRPLASLDDVVDFYNMGKTQGDPPTELGGSFSSSGGDLVPSVNGGSIVTSQTYKRDIVRAYVKEINASRVLDGR